MKCFRKLLISCCIIIMFNSPLSYGQRNINRELISDEGVSLKDNGCDKSVPMLKSNRLKLTSFTLEQNYPNPFNPSTTIRFNLPATSKATLKIYNVVGQLIATLVDQQLSQGYHELQWRADNIPSGIYFYSLKSGSFAETNRMILLK